MARTTAFRAPSRSGRADEKIKNKLLAAKLAHFTGNQEQADQHKAKRVYYGAVFEIKKEIPVTSEPLTK